MAERFNGWGWGEEADLTPLVGTDVVEIRMTDEYLIFIGRDGEKIGFGVEGDCCSHSYFYDMVGADKLLANGPVIEANRLDLSDQDVWDQDEYEDIKVYGYEVVSEHPFWGPQTTVVSFRNSSNGYYGGWMTRIKVPDEWDLLEMHPVTGEHFEVP